MKAEPAIPPARFNFLRKLDFYGYVPELLYRGESAHNTRYGGLISLVSVLGYLAITIFTVWRYFQREAPATNINQSYNPNPEGFVWDREKFPFAFGIQNPGYEHFIDDEVYTLDALYRKKIVTRVNGEKKEDWIDEMLPVIRCSQANLDLTYFDNIPLDTLFCIKEFVEPTNSLNLSGRFESDFFGRMEFQFKKCSPEKSKCKNETVIGNLLRDSYFAIYYVDRVAKAPVYENPIEKFPRSQFTSTSIDYTKYLHFYLMTTKIETDASLVGYLQPEVISFQGTGYQLSDMSNLATAANPVLPEVFFNLVLRISTISTVVTRKYKNIYDYLAEFGGMSQVVAVAAIVLCFRMQRLNLLMDLAKRLISKEDLYQRLLEESTKTITQAGIDPDSPTSKESKFGKRQLKNVDDKSGAGPIVKGRTKAPKVVTALGPGTDKSHGFSAYSGFRNNPDSAPLKPPKENYKPGSPVSHELKPKHAQAHDGEDSMNMEVPEEGNDRQAVKEAYFFQENNLQKKSTVTGQSSSGQTIELRNYRVSSPDASPDPAQHERTDKISQNNGIKTIDEVTAKLEESPINKGALTFTAKSGFTKSVNYEDCYTPKTRMTRETLDLIGPMKRVHREEHTRYQALKDEMSKISNWKIFLKGFFPCFVGKSRVTLVTEAVEKKVYSNYDFVRIIEAVEDLEKLKTMLMTPEQLLLFNLLPNQRMQFNQKEKRFTMVSKRRQHSMKEPNDDENYFTRKREIEEAFEGLQLKEDKTELDKNLLKSLGFLVKQYDTS